MRKYTVSLFIASLVFSPIWYALENAGDGDGIPSAFILILYSGVMTHIFSSIGAMFYNYDGMKQECDKKFIELYNANTTFQVDNDCLYVKFTEPVFYQVRRDKKEKFLTEETYSKGDTHTIEVVVRVFDRKHNLRHYKKLSQILSDEQKDEITDVFKNVKCWYDDKRITFNESDVHLEPIQSVNLSESCIYHNHHKVMVEYPCSAETNYVLMAKYGVPYVIGLFLIIFVIEWIFL